MKKLGFIGLGIMGKPMAKNLLKAGYTVTAYDVVAENLNDVVAAGANKGESPRHVAKVSDIIITMLPNSPHVQEVVLGEHGVIEGAKKGSILIDMSSINPIVSKEVATKLKPFGVDMLDAPVSGGEPKAIDGTLAIMVGGVEKIFEQAKPILEVMGGSVTLVGEIGSGNTTKLANQIMVAGNIAAMGEALTLATKAGVNPEKVYQAIRGGLAGSTVLDAKAPLVLEGNFAPGFRIELHIKDLNNAVDTAKEIDTPIPITKQTLHIMEILDQQGKGSDDHGGMVQFYEELSGVQVRKA